jgi:hypothetical protein
MRHLQVLCQHHKVSSSPAEIILCVVSQKIDNTNENLYIYYYYYIYLKAEFNSNQVTTRGQKRCCFWIFFIICDTLVRCVLRLFLDLLCPREHNNENSLFRKFNKEYLVMKINRNIWWITWVCTWACHANKRWSEFLCVAIL